MIKFLYTNTLSQGIPKNIQSPNPSDVSYVNTWVRAVLEKPDKNIFIKTLGLQFLEDKDFEVFKEFDIVYTHLIPIADIGRYKWHDFPHLIKEKLGKDTPKVMMAIDNEMSHIPPTPQIQKALDSSDLIAAVTKPVLEAWSLYTKTPVRYIPAPKYYHLIRDPVPIEKREKTISLMRHTWVPPEDSTGLNTQLQVCRKLGCNVKIFTGWFNESSEKTERFAKQRGVTKVKTFTRLDRVPYFDELSTCWLAIEDEYIGASRFAAECAALKIPTVGTDYITGARVANPDLVTPRRSVDQKVELIKRLFTDMDFYKEQCEVSSKNIREHYDAGVCLDRLKKGWKEIGVD